MNDSMLFKVDFFLKLLQSFMYMFQRSIDDKFAFEFFYKRECVRLSNVPLLFEILVEGWGKLGVELGCLGDSKLFHQLIKGLSSNFGLLGIFLIIEFWCKLL